MTLSYTFTPFAYPGAFNTFGYDINDSGQVAGLYYNSTYHAFLYSGGGYTNIDDPLSANPLVVSAATAISNDGVTGYFINALIGPRGFVYENGVYVAFDAGAGNTIPLDINDSGQ